MRFNLKAALGFAFGGPGVITNLARDHRVLAIDLRGHGGSDKPHTPAAYGAEMGRDVIRLLDHLGIPRAHLVGYSLGGMIAGYLVTTAPNRFATVTFLAGAPMRTSTASDSALFESLAVELEGPTPFKSLLVRLTPPGSPPPTDSAIRVGSQSMAARNDVLALAALNRGMPGLLVTDAQVAAVRTPVQGIVGTADVNIDGLRALKTVMPALGIIAVDGVTHPGIVGRAELVDAVRAFVAAHRVGAR
jgi:pimeloyl-ACP methyl ester carboxylesterase